MDKCDELTEEQIEDLLQENTASTAPNHVKAFIDKLIRFDGFCIPTTCAYQFIFKNEPNGNIEQYFSLVVSPSTPCLNEHIIVWTRVHEPNHRLYADHAWVLEWGGET